MDKTAYLKCTGRMLKRALELSDVWGAAKDAGSRAKDLGKASVDKLRDLGSRAGQGIADKLKEAGDRYRPTGKSPALFRPPTFDNHFAMPAREMSGAAGLVGKISPTLGALGQVGAGLAADWNGRAPGRRIDAVFDVKSSIDDTLGDVQDRMWGDRLARFVRAPDREQFIKDNPDLGYRDWHRASSYYDKALAGAK